MGNIMRSFLGHAADEIIGPSVQGLGNSYKPKTVFAVVSSAQSKVDFKLLFIKNCITSTTQPFRCAFTIKAD